MNKKIEDLSKGMQQKIQFIATVLHKPKLLILDEPFSHLDKANAEIALKMINDQCDSLNAGFVLTSLGDDYGYNYSRELNL